MGLWREAPLKLGTSRRIINTVLLILLFRLLANIPVANVDEERLHELLKENALLGAIDLFAGGEVLAKFSVVAVGLFPYLLATALVMVAARLIPALRRLEREAEEERAKLITRAISIPVAFVLAWGLAHWLSLRAGLFPGHLKFFSRPDFLSTMLIVSIVTAGSWLTEKIKDWITKHGIGAGESVILLVGASLTFVNRLAEVVFSGLGPRLLVSQLAFAACVGAVVITLSIPLLTAVRKIPMTLVRAPRSNATEGKSYAPEPFLPLLLNRGGTAPVSSAIGVMVLIHFASMGLAWLFPGRFGSIQAGLAGLTSTDHGAYWATLALFIMAFTYIANFSLLWKPYKNSDKSLARYLQTEGNSVFITGVRPGQQSAIFLSRVMTRITLPAAVTLAFLVAGLPYLIRKYGAGNTAIDTLAVIIFVKSFLEVRESFDNNRALDRPYEGFLRKGRIRGRVDTR